MRAYSDGERLVRKMLTFARQRPRNPKRGDLVKPTQVALVLFKVLAPPSVETCFDNAITAAFSDFDTTLFYQCLLNLRHNAFEAMGNRPGEVVARINLSNEDALYDLPDEAVGMIRLGVSDTEPGLSPEQQAARWSGKSTCSWSMTVTTSCMSRAGR